MARDKSKDGLCQDVQEGFGRDLEMRDQYCFLSVCEQAFKANRNVVDCNS